MILDPSEIKAVDVADVFKGDDLAGQLRRMPDHVAFVYAPGYVEAGGQPVATTLPVSRMTYRTQGGSVPAFFAGLLPEGARLQTLIRNIKTSADDEMSLLLAVARDAIGDVSVVPVGERPRDPSETSGVISPLGVSFQTLLARSVTGTEEPFDTALPGFQEKLSDDLISFPVQAGGGPAILKLSPPRYPLLVENEAFFLSMAAACGFRVPPFRVVHDRRGESGLLVERFDRISRSWTGHAYSAGRCLPTVRPLAC